MQIPLTLPEHTTPLPTRRDVQALSPVSPIPGVEGLAETLDPRLALQWTQPVLSDQSADLTRSALEAVVNGSPEADTAPGKTPATLSTGTVTWSSLAQVLGPLLQRISALPPGTPVPWPAAPTSATSIEGAVQDADAPALLPALHSVRQQLTRSDLFAPQHLFRHWFKSPESSDSSSASPEEPDQTTLARWVSALSPESPTAEQVTRMLLTGKMHWQGDLLPGIAVQLDREDAWREDPAHPGQVEKGAAVRAQIDLPRSGRMTVWAYQWGSHIDLRVNMPAAPDSALELAWPDLQARLAQLNLPDLQLGRVATP